MAKKTKNLTVTFERVPLKSYSKDIDLCEGCILFENGNCKRDGLPYEIQETFTMHDCEEIENEGSLGLTKPKERYIHYIWKVKL